MLHQLYHVDWEAWNELKPKKQARLQKESARLLRCLAEAGDGETAAFYHILGHKGDLMFVITRREAHDLARVERRLAELPIWPYLEPSYSYFSVVELSLHGVAERYRNMLLERGLEEGSAAWDAALEELLEEDRQIQKARLYPEIPADRYICFYPMDKKRGEVKNWFMLESRDRGKLMAAHGKTGRKYFGKVSQIISSSMGLDDFDWGVDLFAQNPLYFKKLIYEMRFDEVSAIYAEFGPFMIGCRLDPERLLERDPWDDEVGGPRGRRVSPPWNREISAEPTPADDAVEE